MIERDGQGHQLLESGVYVSKVGDQASRDIRPGEIVIVESINDKKIRITGYIVNTASLYRKDLERGINSFQYKHLISDTELAYVLKFVKHKQKNLDMVRGGLETFALNAGLTLPEEDSSSKE